MSDRYLSTLLRRTLEKAVKQARDVAEEGARDAIQRLGVADGKAPAYLNDAEKELRRRLRAHARALGDTFDRATDAQQTKRLVEATAYAHWHRMLFTRFLAERNLLRHPQHDVPVTLEDCRELASEEGLSDGWAVAERYAAAMLPGVFRLDDPVLDVEYDAVHTQTLTRLVTDLDAAVFQAEDSLGWTYQFWRAAEKDAVNKSGVKIGADELPAVTQLFTEPYMVRFLLHNTLGAWWAGKVLAADPALTQTAADEDALRAACSLPGYTFDMLRFVREGEDGPWRAAAGAFPGWPREAKAITVLDPCCGSGHFLTEALAILAALRQVEEHLSPADAVTAALRDNLHGLEIDGRCVQIAAFAVALTAWRLGGWQTLPLPHIAWVGAPPPLPKREFVALADGSAELEYALAALHDLFGRAPILGTLLEPLGGDLFEAEKMKQIERLLEPLLSRVRQAEPEQREGVIAARGMSDAAAFLHQTYILQTTNVPYLGRGKQALQLADFVERNYKNEKSDIAAAMLSRMGKLAAPNGTVASVSPQNWLFLKSFQSMRRDYLRSLEMNLIAALGEEAWEYFGDRGPLALLAIWSKVNPNDRSTHAAIDCSVISNRSKKIEHLKTGKLAIISQISQFKAIDSIISFEKRANLKALSDFCKPVEGLSSGDGDRFCRSFWEVPQNGSKFSWFQGTPDGPTAYSGRSTILLWEQGQGMLASSPAARVQGHGAWGKDGILVGMMRHIPATIYTGDIHEKITAALIPLDERDLPAIYSYISSSEYRDELRKIDKRHAVATATLTKVPFDREKWAAIARETFYGDLVQPFSDDPTQWLFHGHPQNCRVGVTIHVALARLCGYLWPAETDPNIRLSDEARTWITRATLLPTGDNDGLLSIPAVAGEKPLAERLRVYLAAAFGSVWSDVLERRLVAEADELLDKKTARDGSLEAWLRDRAFRQHCALFGQRPFLWHIWDGLKDGFSVFVHYHRFDQAALRKLTYTMLGDWLARAQAEGNQLRYEKGRELQQTLEKILEGEKPYDIFVRWKSLAQLPIGWNPNLDDGVRMNIRPFVLADVLRDTPKIKWTKDRGTDVPSAPWYPVFKGERINDRHTTLAEKRAAREAASKRLEAAK